MSSSETALSRGPEHPGAHLGLTWRPLSVDDVEAAAALALAADAADRPLHPFTPHQIVQALTSPAADLAHNSLAGFSPQGVLRAMGLVRGEPERHRALLLATIHPQWRRRGIGRSLLRWQDARARQLLEESGTGAEGLRGARIGVFVDEHLTDRRRMCAAAGFAPVRWYRVLERQVRGADLPPVAPVPRVRIVGLGPQWSEATRMAHHEAFARDFEPAVLSPRRWAERMAGTHFPWSFLALTERDEIAGYVLSSRSPQAWTDGTFGSTDFLGVRPAHRGRGIGRALLTRAIRAYAADDIQGARLDVDTENSSGALDLYASLGYEAREATVLYSIEL